LPGVIESQVGGSWRRSSAGWPDPRRARWRRVGARPGRVSLGRRPILLAPQLDGRTRTGLDV